MTGVRTSSNGQIQPRNGGAQTTAIQSADQATQGLRGMLAKYAPEFGRVLSKALPADKFVRLAMTALTTTRNLDKCTPASFIGCNLQLAVLNLEPNTMLGHAYLIPRELKQKQGGQWVKTGQYECTMIIGYQGLLELLRRTGDVANIQARVVREGDDWDLQYGLEPRLYHKPSNRPDRELLPIMGAYAIVKFKDGSSQWEFLTREQIEERRRVNYGTEDKSSPWVKHYESMCCKTAIRAMCKLAPKSTELATAIAVDERHEDGAHGAHAFAVTPTDSGLTNLLQTSGEPADADSQNAEPEPPSSPRANDDDDDVAELLGPAGGAQ